MKFLIGSGIWREGGDLWVGWFRGWMQVGAGFLANFRAHVGQTFFTIIF